MSGLSRRSLLEGLGAATGALLYQTRFARAASSGGAGRLELSLSGLSDGLLRISLSPLADPIQPDELGVVTPPAAVSLLAPAPVQARIVAWGRYQIEILDNPLRVRVSADGALRSGGAPVQSRPSARRRPERAGT